MKKLLITATLLLLLSLKPLFAGVAKGVDVREVQTILTELCFNPGPIDGVWGQKTEKAVEEFFTKYTLKYDGTFDDYELYHLQAFNRSSERHVMGIKIERCFSSKVNNIKPLISEYIKGVSQDQWNVIKKLGDPQNCESRVRNLNSLQGGAKISADEFNNKSAVSNAKFYKNSIIIFGDGTYKLKNTITLFGKTLIGTPKTVIDASSVGTAFRVHEGGLKNVIIVNAAQTGINVLQNSIVHNVIVDKTGIGFTNNSRGFGINMTSTGSKNNCIVSVEVSNGYNEAGNACCKRGGNADGFRVTFGAHNVKFVDAHSHHNSDDGFDFWKGGNAADIAFDETSYRIFYSSSNLNGKNPFTKNGDGNGYKLGSTGQDAKKRKDAGSKLIYGSVACYNASNGFDRNGTRTKIIASRIQASGNRHKNYQRVSNNFRTDKDPNVLKCDMFPRK